MIEAVFFDLYGTLAGFEPSRYHLQATACADFGIHVTPEGVLKGYALADSFMAEQNAVQPIRQLTDDERQDFFDEYQRLILKGCNVKVSSATARSIWCRIRALPYRLTVFADVFPVLNHLRSKGIILGLISNMNYTGTHLLDCLGLASYLDFAITSKEVGIEKPHPAIFNAALTKSGSTASTSVHVGDQMKSDIEGARNAGISAILVDRDGNHKGVINTPRVESMSELPAVLKEIGGNFL